MMGSRGAAPPDPGATAGASLSDLAAQAAKTLAVITAEIETLREEQAKAAPIREALNKAQSEHDERAAALATDAAAIAKRESDLRKEKAKFEAFVNETKRRAEEVQHQAEELEVQRQAFADTASRIGAEQHAAHIQQMAEIVRVQKENEAKLTRMREELEQARVAAAAEAAANEAALTARQNHVETLAAQLRAAREALSADL